MEDLKQTVKELNSQVETLQKEILAQEDIIQWLRNELEGLRPEMTLTMSVYPGSAVEIAPTK